MTKGIKTCVLIFAACFYAYVSNWLDLRHLDLLVLVLMVHLSLFVHVRLGKLAVERLVILGIHQHLVGLGTLRDCTLLMFDVSVSTFVACSQYLGQPGQHWNTHHLQKNCCPRTICGYIVIFRLDVWF
jgi:hypothetical protein